MTETMVVVKFFLSHLGMFNHISKQPWYQEKNYFGKVPRLPLYGFIYWLRL